jgi:aminoacylase
MDGMAKFVNTSDFFELNVGFALDEGIADPSDQFHLFYGERSIWRKYLFKQGFIFLFFFFIIYVWNSFSRN